MNPTDNTDIYLAYSDDGGRTWVGTRRVNQDNAQTDGFSEDFSGLSGRPQFMPQVAVDQATGALVLSWLDARNDAARAAGGDLSELQPRRRQHLLAGGLRQRPPDRDRRDHGPTGQPRADPRQRVAGQLAHGRDRGLRRSDGPGRLRRPRHPGLGEQPQRQHERQAPARHLHGQSSTSPPAPGSSPARRGRSAIPITPRTGTRSSARSTSPSTVRSTRRASPPAWSRSSSTTRRRTTPPAAWSRSPGSRCSTRNAYGATQFRILFEPRHAVGTYSYSISPGISDRIRKSITSTTPAGSPLPPFNSTGAPQPLPTRRRGRSRRAS